MAQDLRCVFLAHGEVEAQQVVAFLRASGVPSTLRGESTRLTHGLTLDGLGAVEVCVLPDDEEIAKDLLKSAEAGEFRLDDSKS